MDVAWLILDSDLAHRTWNWAPQISRAEVFEGIAAHADAHPDWISLSAA
jgi:CDP-paratose 2-epimerase